MRDIEENNTWKKINHSFNFLTWIAIGSMVVVFLFFLIFSVWDLPLTQQIIATLSPLLILFPLFFLFKYDLYRSTPYGFAFNNNGVVVYRKFLNLTNDFLSYRNINSIVYEKNEMDWTKIYLKFDNLQEIDSFKNRGRTIIFEEVDKDLAEKLKKEFEKRR